MNSATENGNDAANKTSECGRCAYARKLVAYFRAPVSGTVKHVCRQCVGELSDPGYPTALMDITGRARPSWELV